MEGQLRISSAPSALAVTAYWVPTRGWSMHVAVREDLQGWGEAAYRDFTDLMTDELVDALLGSLTALLRL